MNVENFLLRAASVIAETSFTSCGAFRNREIGAHSLVSLWIITAVPTPQFGWQPQESEPHIASGPCTRSANPANGEMNDSGNQSRVGSILPTCWLTSCARCESV